MNVQYTVYVGVKLMFILCIVLQFYCATYLLNNCLKQSVITYDTILSQVKQLIRMQKY